MKPLTLLLACSLSATCVLAQDHASSQIAQVRAEFAGKSLAEINAALARMRPLAVSESDKQILLRDLPLITENNKVTHRPTLDRLVARLQATLELHDRVGVIEFVIFHDSRPIAYNKPGVVVVLSTEVLRIVGDDDAALVGVVAHELAHEYIAMPMLYALRARDNVKRRKLELFCDAVAVVTLLSLQLSPNSYSRALERICRHSKAAAALNDGSLDHPSLDTRLKLIAEIKAVLEPSIRLFNTFRNAKKQTQVSYVNSTTTKRGSYTASRSPFQQHAEKRESPISLFMTCVIRSAHGWPMPVLTL